MKLFKQNRRTQIEALSDFCFFVFLLTEFIFTHTIIGQVGLLMFLGVVALLIFEKRKVYSSLFFIFQVIFILYNYYNIKIGNSINSSTSLAMLSTLTVNLVVGVVIFNYLTIRNNMKNSLDIYIKACIIFSIFVFTVSVPTLFKGRIGGNYNFLGINYSLNSNAIAIIAVIAFLFVYYNYLSTKKRNSLMKLIWFAFIIFVSGSRKGIVILVAGSLALLYWMFPNKRMKNIRTTLVFILFTYFIIMYVPAFYKIIGIRIQETLKYLMGETYQDGSLDSRLSYIELGWRYFIQRPWKGYGLDCFRHLPKAYGTYSHNNYIELLVSGGIPALIIYYSGYIYALLKTYQQSRQGESIAKLFTILIIVRMVLDYAMVSYFERLTLIIILLALSSSKIVGLKSKSNHRTDGSEN